MLQMAHRKGSDMFFLRARDATFLPLSDPYPPSNSFFSSNLTILYFVYFVFRRYGRDAVLCVYGQEQGGPRPSEYFSLSFRWPFCPSKSLFPHFGIKMSIIRAPKMSVARICLQTVARPRIVSTPTSKTSPSPASTLAWPYFSLPSFLFHQRHWFL